MQFKVSKGCKYIFCIICSFRTHDFSIAVVILFFQSSFTHRISRVPPTKLHFFHNNVLVLSKMRNNLEKPETIYKYLKPSRNYLTKARKQLTSPETSQEITISSWNQSYHTNFLQEWSKCSIYLFHFYENPPVDHTY